MKILLIVNDFFYIFDSINLIIFHKNHRIFNHYPISFQKMNSIKPYKYTYKNYHHLKFQCFFYKTNGDIPIKIN